MSCFIFQFLWFFNHNTSSLIHSYLGAGRSNVCNWPRIFRFRDHSGSTSCTIDSIWSCISIANMHPRERSVGGDEPVMHRRAWDRYAGKVRSSSRMRSRVALLRAWSVSWDRHEDFLHLVRGIIEDLYPDLSARRIINIAFILIIKYSIYLNNSSRFWLQILWIFITHCSKKFMNNYV